MHHIRWPFEPVSATAIAVVVLTLFSVAAQELIYPGHVSKLCTYAKWSPSTYVTIVRVRCWVGFDIEAFGYGYS